MLHEAKERQKFVSKVQYLRDMQHKVDSEYQACLRRQEYRKDPNEKKRDQFWGQETNLERSRFLSGSSSKQSHRERERERERQREKQTPYREPDAGLNPGSPGPRPGPKSSAEEDPLAEPRPSTKSSAAQCDSRLPAIDQTSVKQKHKSTMTPRKLEKAGPSKPSSAAQEPQILSRKRRPKLGTLIVSPETQSLRVLGARSRLKSQLPTKAPALRGPDPIIQQEGPMWASDTKLKRPTQERRNVVSSSQLMTMTENTSERAKKGDSSALSQNEPHPALPQAFQGTNTPQVLSESLRPPLLTTTMGGPRRAPFRFRDEDFYSILSLDPGGESDDTEEETLIAEELLLVVSDFPNQSDNGNRMAVSAFKDEKEAIKIKADPEKLKKLQESLLQEDSEEEDGDLCRICQIAGGSPTNPLLEPCGCVGSLRFVHQECLKKWLKVKITSGADLGAVKTCEMCKQGLLVDLDDFNVTDFYQKHQQSRAQNELMNSGLYLVLLLHLYEQRFAELMRLNYNRVARERPVNVIRTLRMGFCCSDQLPKGSRSAHTAEFRSPEPRAKLSRNYPQPRREENENAELGDGLESSSHAV
ncbi:probable E3 ubiquitin-protein ligase MARCHF10 isoform X6 [Canis lupus baileyi]|uniref:probable E3 ubiquitin-protein ligase MARCHF10 isoform X6 n=1 Tax=Canis lupus baileyi TaxID=143281 RepID=UPI003B978305